MRISWILVLLLCAGVIAPVLVADASSSGASAEISLHEYISELDRCSQTLADPASGPAELRALRDTLPPEWRVQSGGVTYSVETKWLGDALAGIATGPAAQQAQRLAATKARVAALRQSAEALDAEDTTGASGQTSRQQERAKLDKILRAKEFQGAQGPSWFDQLKARFFDWLEKQWDKLHLPHTQSIGNTVAWLVIILATALVAVWAVRNFVRGRSMEMDLRGAAAAGFDWRDWLREARSAAERGDYRAAIHAAYWAGVSRTEEAGLLPEDRSRTPRESLRLVARERSEYAPLAALTRSFELVWYGYRAATETDWNNAQRQLELLENARVPRPA